MAEMYLMKKNKFIFIIYIFIDMKHFEFNKKNQLLILMTS
jgi:hypothetical protein